jgi:di/tricarboxylate transporter
MGLAEISLAALGLVVIASCTLRLNPGFLAIVLAWVIGVYLAPRWNTEIGLKGVAAGFPAELFLTLVGVTLLFTQAQVNGTLDQVARVAVRSCRGNVGLMPVMYFVLTCAFASAGAGNIAGAALMAPLAMATAVRAGIPAFLMTIMVAHGALAGALSPFAPTGIIANNLLNDKLGVTGLAWQTYCHNLLANTAVAFAGYLAFGGWRLFTRSDDETTALASADAQADRPFELRHAMTLGVIGVTIVYVLCYGVHVGMAAFTGAAVLTLLRLADEGEAVRRMPWGVIVMVCGVTVLTALLEKTGGTDLLARQVARFSDARTVTGVVALLTGLVSVYSSTSGVVLPAFLPMVSTLAGEVGGNPLAIASSIIVGGHLVDSSPLSTIGALCVASAPPSQDPRLFAKVLAWGLSMAVVGAAVCYLFFGLLM